MAASENRPASREQAPDPSRSYERARPEDEAGMGRLESNPAVTTNDPDRQQQAVPNKQDPTHQINAEDQTNQRRSGTPGAEPDHSMHDEEPLGEDQAPLDIHDPRRKRHPRTEGRGGLK